MKKITDLEAVKDTAKAMVYLDIELTPLSPMVVKHPFTDAGVTGIRGESGFELVNLLEDEDGLNKWRKSLVSTIEAMPSVFSLFSMVTRAYKLSFFDFIRNDLSREDFSSLLRDMWIDIEFVSTNPVFTKAQLVSFFKKSDQAHLMSKLERDSLAALPDEVVIYRGVRAKSKKVKGMSWTTDRTVAAWFAGRYARNGESGDVYSAVINKSDVLAYFSDHSEKEIVVDPKNLREIVTNKEAG